ncbi:MAG: 5-oxoprolinase subunit PxpA [Acidimicrobiales bacterium]
MPSVDLNADVGEGSNLDTDLLDTVTSASVACGFHAGDPLLMRRTVHEAAHRGVAVGAHPSYPDRPGFGRRELDIAPEQIAADVLYQVGALQALAAASGARVRYVKPHGALYHRMAGDEASARAVVEAVRNAGALVLLAPPAAVVLDVAAALGVPTATEAFADRAYRGDGTLVARSEPGAVLTDPAEVARRALVLVVDKRMPTVDGTVLELEASSICVHSDTPGSGEIARAVRRMLESAGVTVAPFAP